MSAPDPSRIVLGTIVSVAAAALVGAGIGFILDGCVQSVKADPIPGVAETYTTQPSTIPSVKLDKCPVSRANFDALKMNTPEVFMTDVMPCIKGEVVQEYEVGYGRRSVPLRVWKFPREGGGHLFVTTTDYRVSAKAWE